MLPVRTLARRAPLDCIVVAATLGCVLVPLPADAQWGFTDQTTAAGLNVSHSVDTLGTVDRETAAGVACSDYNGDGWLDLYFLGGNTQSNFLFRNNGNGTFSDVASAAGVDMPNSLTNGTCFADWDGDGDPDLFVGGLEGLGATLFENDGDGTFTDVTASSGVTMTTEMYSSTFGDLNGDGYLDLLVAHWGESPQPTGHLWLNDGDGTFTDSDVALGYAGFPPPGGDNTFTYNLADIDSDGDSDLLVTSDFLTSHIYRNDGATLTNITNTGVITDQNGMGSAVGDYDNDGDLDWFNSSIFEAPFNPGNKLYENDGSGNFTDVTQTAGVQSGFWGWGVSMQDFNNDGFLDIYHVNGWRFPTKWNGTPARMFVSNGVSKTFTESSVAVGVNHPGQGRGVVAFDYDRDGDLDLFLANNDAPAIFLRNDGLTTNWLSVKLVGGAPNVDQVGARVKVTIGATTQMRELRCGSNFLSQDPVEAHFGLGAAATVDQLTVEWTDGTSTMLSTVAANQHMTITHPAVDSPVVGPKAQGAIELLGAAPNPFHSGTLIRFSLAQASETSVTVYDAAGRHVRTVVDGARAGGGHGVTWDGRDESGRAVGSGVYYYEVRTETEAARGKMVRLR